MPAKESRQEAMQQLRFMYLTLWFIFTLLWLVSMAWIIGYKLFFYNIRQPLLFNHILSSFEGVTSIVWLSPKGLSTQTILLPRRGQLSCTWKVHWRSVSFEAKSKIIVQPTQTTPSHYLQLNRMTHPHDSVPDCYERETKKESKEPADISNERCPKNIVNPNLAHHSNFLSKPRIEQLLNIHISCPGSRLESNWKMRRLKTCRSCFREQLILVVMAGTNAAGQGVDEMEFFESHFVEEQLILMVL